MRVRRYRGQRTLARAIRAYRRLASGRGPFRRVVCTFGHTESCSAYGLRVADEVARSLPQALALIRGRLRRCGSAALYRVPAGSDATPGLLWGEALDRDPAELDAELDAAGERDDTRALVLRARAMVARYSGDPGVMQHSLSRARALASERSGLVVRRGAGLLHAQYQRLCGRIAAAVLLQGALVIGAPAWLAAVCGVIVAGLAWQWSRYCIRRARRIDRLLAASRFRRRRAAVGLDRRIGPIA